MMDYPFQLVVIGIYNHSLQWLIYTKSKIAYSKRLIHKIITKIINYISHKINPYIQCAKIHKSYRLTYCGLPQELYLR